MLNFQTPFAHGPIIAANPQGEAADWVRSFAGGRLAGLALAFCIAPFTLAVPVLRTEAIAVLVAALVSSVCGLVAIKLFSRAGSIAMASIAGYAGLLAGAWAGLSPAVIGLAALVMLVDALAVPGNSRSSLAVFATVAVMALLIACAALWAPPAGMAQFAVATLLLPVPAGLTLAQQLLNLRRIAREKTAVAASAERRGRVMVDATSAAVVIADRAGNIVDATDRAGVFLACEASSLFGRGFVDRVLIADRPAFLKALSDASVYQQASQLSVRMTASAGHADVELDVRPSETAPDVVSIRILGSVAASRSVNRAALFASLSHEVRTPMNAILGFSEMLANPVLCPTDQTKIAEYARIIHRQGQHTFAVTSALVDLLRVESTHFGSPEHVDLAALLRHTLAQAPRGGEVTTALAGDEHAGHIMADPQALRILLRALVDGLVTATQGQGQLICTFERVETLPSLTFEATGQATAGNDNSAFVGIVEILARRTAAAIGAGVTISATSAGWRARIDFSGSNLVPLPTHAAAFETSNVVPLKKSA